VGQAVKRQLPVDLEDGVASKRLLLVDQDGVRTGDGATAAGKAPAQGEMRQDVTTVSVTGDGASSGLERTTGVVAARRPHRRRRTTLRRSTCYPPRPWRSKTRESR
jgi:hypothetical protein